MDLTGKENIMKYTKIKGSPVEDGTVRFVHLERACKECGFSLRGEEKFCPECGHKLLRLEEKVSEDFILGILNGRDKTIAVGEVGNNDFASVTAKDVSDVSVYVQEVGSGESHYTPKCLYGLDKATCGHCTPKGACDRQISTHMPPKYLMCPFHGDGLIDCKDA